MRSTIALEWDGISSDAVCPADPLGYEAGDANLTRYVGNGPTNFADPTGLKKRRGNQPPPAPAANSVDKRVLPDLAKNYQQNNQERYWLVVAANCNDEVLNGYLGHSFVALVDAGDGSDGWSVTRGLYPADNVGDDLEKMAKGCYGQLNNDGGTSFTTARAFLLTEEEYKRLRTILTDWYVHGPDTTVVGLGEDVGYDLQDYNCTTFAIDFALYIAINLNVSSTGVLVHGGENNPDKPDYRPGDLDKALKMHPDGRLYGAAP